MSGTISDAFNNLKNSLGNLLGPISPTVGVANSTAKTAGTQAANKLTGDLGNAITYLEGGVGNILFVLIGVLLIAAAIFYFVGSNKQVQQVVTTAAKVAA